MNIMEFVIINILKIYHSKVDKTNQIKMYDLNAVQA